MNSESLKEKKEYYQVLRETLEILDEPLADSETKINALRRTLEGLITERELALESTALLHEQVQNLADLVIHLSENNG